MWEDKIKTRTIATAIALLALAACNQPTATTVEPEPRAIAAAGEMCGGIAGIACGEVLYCQYPEGTCGAADQSGACQDVPDICTTEVNPVCGCDDTTYSNACEAARAGVSVVSAGACPPRAQ